MSFQDETIIVLHLEKIMPFGQVHISLYAMLSLPNRLTAKRRKKDLIAHE